MERSEFNLHSFDLNQVLEELLEEAHEHRIVQPVNIVDLSPCCFIEDTHSGIDGFEEELLEHVCSWHGERFAGEVLDLHALIELRLGFLLPLLHGVHFSFKLLLSSWIFFGWPSSMSTLSRHQSVLYVARTMTSKLASDTIIVVTKRHCVGILWPSLQLEQVHVGQVLDDVLLHALAHSFWVDC